MAKIFKYKISIFTITVKLELHTINEAIKRDYI